MVIALSHFHCSLVFNNVHLFSGYFNQSMVSQFYSSLSCSKSPQYEKIPDLHYDRFLYDKMSMCFFPGSPFYKLTQRLIRVEKEVGLIFLMPSCNLIRIVFFYFIF